MLKLGIDPEKLYRATFIRQYGLCCCNMALVSFQLFCKNLGHLRDFFWANGLPPPRPGKKFPVRLCLSALTSRFLRTLQQNRAQSKLLYLLYDKESDKISTRCFLIFKTNYWHMAWQLQLRVLYSHKARFVNQPKSELYLNFLILNICIP